MSRRPSRPVIFFDLDGTLLDVRERYFTLHCHIARQLSVDPGTADDFWRLKRRRAPSTLLLGDIGASEAANYDHLWLNLVETAPFTDLDTPFPGALHVLHELQDSATLALATLRRDAVIVRQQLRRLGLAPLFDEVLVSGEFADVHRSKPALIQRSRWKDSRLAVVVGDTEDDADAAEALHVPFIAVDTGLREASQLRERAASVICSLEELSQTLPWLLKTNH